ncbi:MAG TPA: type II toxin-antitoxin system VapC family toxin [bacterium]|jgi:predicted nucleic acid-binding protein|nr:type II toxin-antitoxin system VapC family toxin [bacterium]
MIFDTDVLIWAIRGNSIAAHWIDDVSQRHVSAQSYMELLRGAKDAKELKSLKNYIQQAGFHLLPITENISHRAMIYVEELALSHNLAPGDALIAATAVEHNLLLATGNAKHFKAIKGLELKVFKP